MSAPTPPAANGAAAAASAPKPPVKFTLNGKEVEAAPGSLVIDVAEKNGIHVPRYCYHPALGNPGNCRLCLVEVEGAPKLMVSCRLPVTEGMKVRTNSPAALRAQASSLELHLVNHPLDCPVCDQAGECWLQDYYMQIGLYSSQVREDKRHKDKRVDIGTHVMLDQERCILCTRCTRFLDRVTGTSELGIFNRGDREVLAPYPGMRVDNPYSGNIIDVCPVGALTDKDFRYKIRVWYLERIPSVCSGCSRGCSIEAHVSKRRWHNEGKRVARYKPRVNPDVNGYWMCDEGRYGFGFHDDARYGKFRRRGAEGFAQVEWGPGLADLSLRLDALRKEKGADGLAVVLSGALSNEDLFVAKKYFAETLGVSKLLFGPGPEQLGEEDKLLRRKEKVPNLKGAETMGYGSRIPETTWDALRAGIESGKVWGLWVVGRDPGKVWGEEKAKELAAKLALSVFQGSNACGFAEACQWVLPAATHLEEQGTFTNFEGRVQRFEQGCDPVGQSLPEWRVWRDLLRQRGLAAPWEDAGSVFAALGAAERPFAGLGWAELAPHGRLLGHAAVQGAGA